MMRHRANLLQHVIRTATNAQPSLVCASPTLNKVPCRNTHVVKLYKVEKMQSQLPDLAPDPQQVHKLSDPRYIYETISDFRIPERQLDVMLLTTVDGLGRPGEVVSVESNKARKELLLPKLAVYASPENVERYSYLLHEDSDDKPSSIYVQKTLLTLGGVCVFVSMNVREPWTLERWHIRVAMRKNNLVVTTDDAIILPDEPISGPNLDFERKFFYVTLLINNREKIRLRCLLHHVSANPEFKLPAQALDLLDEPPIAVLPSQQKYLTALFHQRKIYEHSREPQLTPEEVDGPEDSSSSISSISSSGDTQDNQRPTV